MKYLIDSANSKEIDEAIKLGFAGITANPTMYKNENITLEDFIKKNNSKTKIITAEVIGDTKEELIDQINNIISISNNIIIKLNFGKKELEIGQYLRSKNISFSYTLIFNIQQALLSFQAGADYIFFFIGRNEEEGIDPNKVLYDIKKIRDEKKYKTKIIGASIRNTKQLNDSALYCDYAAIRLETLENTFSNKQTLKGIDTFTKDFNQ